MGETSNRMRAGRLEIEQLRLGRLAVFGYLVGDEASKTCGLIDPAFETDRILAEAEQRGYEVTHVINTHCHSDHTAGNAAILAATGAKLLIHKLDAEGLSAGTNKAFSRAMGGSGSPEPDVLLEDGDIIEIGETSLEVIHTPGHSLGGISLYTEGHVFTGDTLFVGAVGRTDIGGGSRCPMTRSSGRATTTGYVRTPRSSSRSGPIPSLRARLWSSGRASRAAV